MDLKRTRLGLSIAAICLSVSVALLFVLYVPSFFDENFSASFLLAYHLSTPFLLIAAGIGYLIAFTGSSAYFRVAGASYIVEGVWSLSVFLWERYGAFPSALSTLDSLVEAIAVVAALLGARELFLRFRSGKITLPSIILGIEIACLFFVTVNAIMLIYAKGTFANIVAIATLIFAIIEVVAHIFVIYATLFRIRGDGEKAAQQASH